MEENIFERFIPLIGKKNWIEAFALLVLISNHPVSPKKPMSIKTAWELLKSPSKWKKALEVCKYYKCWDSDWFFQNPDFSLPDMEDDKSQWTKPAWLLCKLLPWSYPQVLNLLNSMGQYILTASATKNLTIEEYIPFLVKEILKDEFWKKQLTAENFVRKFSYLDGKFHKLIPKKIEWWMQSIENIF